MSVLSILHYYGFTQYPITIPTVPGRRDLDFHGTGLLGYCVDPLTRDDTLVPAPVPQFPALQRLYFAAKHCNSRDSYKFLEVFAKAINWLAIEELHIHGDPSQRKPSWVISGLFDAFVSFQEEENITMSMLKVPSIPTITTWTYSKLSTLELVGTIQEWPGFNEDFVSIGPGLESLQIKIGLYLVLQHLT
ncbi:hypothetical protein JAAARDRAFT_51582 [Jaapia argillacea MUCL 33604]|uniref:Uncharacterized protein n=1 Tax=Jaapia argillacea MUCL 33604 TaxID=933084 RepID=A0A067P4E5_9AGAM|nr:hypothetical protein JAAARDRAFT_51582 [Jaapia argillacea MUCL 33604]